MALSSPQKKDSAVTDEGGFTMLSKRWCYFPDANSGKHEVLEFSHPISKQQATFILKKRLQIENVFFIISCNEMMEGK